MILRLKQDGIAYYILGNLTNVLPPDGETNRAIIRTKNLNGIVFTENGAFAYYADWQSVKRRGRFGNVMIADAETVGDTLYFATGKLYAATDMAVPLDVTPSADVYTPDLTMAEDTLCVLACEPQEETYRISVWTLTNGKPVERFYFSYAVPAVSLAYREGVFYLGMGNNDKQNGHALNGTVLAVEFPLS